MKILIVGGVFDSNGGRKSKWLEAFTDALCKVAIELPILVHNGGKYNVLQVIAETLSDYDTVLWLADVDNSYEKFRDIKSINPRCILVTSKRNDDGKYEFKELINRALDQKANLTIEFSKVDHAIYTRLFDPLGAVWCDTTTDITVLAKKLMERLVFLRSVTRQGVIHKEECPPLIQVDKRFLQVIRQRAEEFHNLVMPSDGITRFLGNCSFRCIHGFPSFRDKDIIWVSKRNIDKRSLDEDSFVATYLEDQDHLYYFGDHKPSVDTPVQLRLYRLFPEINYMLHSHVYIKDAPFTKMPIPCGGLQEVREILNVPEIGEGNKAINLLGHGSLMMTVDVDYFSTIQYIERPLPEIIKEEIL